MSGLIVYIFAPRRKGFRGKMQRAVKIERASFHDAALNSYSPGETLLDAWFECDDGTPNRAYVISAAQTKEQVL